MFTHWFFYFWNVRHLTPTMSKHANSCLWMFAHFFNHFFSALYFQNTTFEQHHSLLLVSWFGISHIFLRVYISRAQTESTISTNSPVSLISVKIKRANRCAHSAGNYPLSESLCAHIVHACTLSARIHIVSRRKNDAAKWIAAISTLRLDVLVTTNIMVIKADKWIHCSILKERKLK